MFRLTAADSSSLSYCLPFLLDDQYDFHHFALVLGVETLPGQLGPEVPEAHPAGRGAVVEEGGG